MHPRVGPRHRALSYVLACEQIIRASSYFGRQPQSPLLEVMTAWLPVGLLLSSVIIIGHLITNNNIAGIIGHGLAVVLLIIYTLAVIVQAILYGASWSTAGMAGVCLVLHLWQVRACSRRRVTA